MRCPLVTQRLPKTWASTPEASAVLEAADLNTYVSTPINDLITRATNLETRADDYRTRIVTLETAESGHADDYTTTGMVELWAGGSSNVPSGWLLCNGREVSRTTYADLYRIIGNTYGVSTTSAAFKLPNLVSRVPAGAEATTRTPGVTEGTVENGLRSHTHGLLVQHGGLGSRRGSGTHIVPQYNERADGPARNFNAVYRTHAWQDVGFERGTLTSSASAGASYTRGNVQPTIYMHYIIKT